VRAVQFLKQLLNLGIKVWAEGDRLRVRTSTGLSDEIRRELQERRPDRIEINHEIDIAALRRAVTELLRRYEVLRTSFPPSTVSLCRS